MAEQFCLKCGSNNISFQREQTGSVGGSVHSFKEKKHGVLYWLFVGWWIWIFKVAFIPIKWLIRICTFGLIGKKKKGVSGKTVSASKTINHTVAVCQNCGYSWRI